MGTESGPTGPVRWDRPPDASGDALEAKLPALVTTFKGNRIVVGMEVNGDGDYDLTFSLTLRGQAFTLPQVDRFVLATANAILQQLGETT